MPDFNAGDFTQQGINGHVSATVRLNEKRLVNIDLTSNEEAEGCTISGQITDLLNNTTYSLTPGPSGPDFVIPEQTVSTLASGYVAVEGVDLGDLQINDYVILHMSGEAYGSEIKGYRSGRLYQDNPGDPMYMTFIVPFTVEGVTLTIQIDVIEGAAGDNWGIKITVNNVQTAFENITMSAIAGF